MATRSHGAVSDPLGTTDALNVLAPARDVPNIIEWVCGEQYLNRPTLYPRQGTLLKVMFLQDELFTDYDYEVIEEWSKGFVLPERDDQGVLRYDGRNGMVPDVLERIKILKAEGRKWFREIIFVNGRRGGKGHLGALAGSYVLWNYIALGDPANFFGIDRDKQLAAFVFAGKKEQAKLNQWRDLSVVINGSPALSELINRSLEETLTVYSTEDIADLKTARAENKRLPDMDLATFLIVPKESTAQAGRGPAGFMQFYDEMAFQVTAAGASRSAEEIYIAAKPALDQFGVWGFMYEASSPWQMMGQFYQNWLNGLEVEAATDEHGTHVPVYPEMLTFQFSSWDVYDDWERAHEIPLVPDDYLARMNDPDEKPGVYVPNSYCEQHRRYPRIHHPVQRYDDQMRREERANPQSFAVERRGHWAAAQDAYLSPEKIRAMFGPWRGNILERQEQGILRREYRMHGDPSKSGANFGWIVAHTELDDVEDPDSMLHVIVDVPHAWVPANFDEGEVDYIQIMEEIKGYIRSFHPGAVTFDQWNSVEGRQRLNQWVRNQNLPRTPMIVERHFTHAQNWKRWEIFKTALNMGLVHCPPFELLEAELTFLQEKNGKVDHPDSGTVVTKDVADCISIVVADFLGEQMDAYLQQSLRDITMGVVGPDAPFVHRRRPGSQQTPQEQLSAATGRGNRVGVGTQKARAR